MKRILSLTTVLLALQLPLFAQTSSTASALADKQEAEERYNRMAADVQALQSANASLQKKISALEDRLAKMGEDISKANNNSSVNEDIKVLKEKIQDVDKKREADKQFITEKLKTATENIESMIKTGLSKPTVKEHVVRDTAPAGKPETTTTASDKDYSYTIREGDTLSAIVQAYNKKFVASGMKKIKQSQVEAANPNVNWNRLKVDQKIVIPAPAN